MPQKKDHARKRAVSATPPKRSVGRPTEFDEATRQVFLKHRAEGLTVRAAAEKAGVNAVTVFRHAREDAEFKVQFDEAAELCADDLEDFMETLGRSGNIAALFGSLKKMRPNVWGQHVKVEHSGTLGITGPDELAAARQRSVDRAVAATNGSGLPH